MSSAAHGRIRLALVACAVLAAPAFAAAAEAVDPAIPPGQEELMLEMLGKGAPLPGECALQGATVDHVVINATYACSLGEVVIELSYPTVEEAEDVETDSFAIAVLEGSAPDGLRDALAALVRDKEGDFVWVDPAALPAESPRDRDVAAP